MRLKNYGCVASAKVIDQNTNRITLIFPRILIKKFKKQNDCTGVFFAEKPFRRVQCGSDKVLEIFR